MADIELDINNDILLTNGSMSIVRGSDAIVQQLNIRFDFGLGEWFLDKRLGIPFFEEILIKNPDLNRARAIFRQVIVTTPGIDSVLTFSLNFDAGERRMTIDFTAKKTDGEILEYSSDFVIK